MHEQISIHDLNILLVEPSLPQCRIILKHLEQVGIDKVDFVGNGAEALGHMEARMPDLVISAMYFEDMTGVELIHAIRENPGLSTVPFMLISSETHPHNLEPIRQAGVLAILPKPFDPEALRRAVFTTLDYIEPDRLDLGDVDVEDLRVLVVDDSRFSLRHLTHSLQQLGVEKITEASDGVEAAEKIRDDVYDLVITDYNMPEMDGQQLVNYIRQASDQPDLPVLMVTSESDQTRLASVKQAGVSALCDKPFNTEGLRDVIRRLLSA